MFISARTSRSIFTALLCALAAPAAADAAKPTASSVTSPASPTYVTFDQDVPGPSQQITVSGTSNGSSPDLVDIECTYETSSETFASNVPLDASGNFSVTSTVSPLTGNTQPCTLRALPDNYSTSSDTFPFKGPRIGTLEFDTSENTYPVHGGGTVNTNMYVDFARFGGAGSIESAANTGLDDFYAIRKGSLARFDDETWSEGPELEGNNEDNLATTIQVDGVNAYLPYDAPYMDFDGGDPEGNTYPTGITAVTTTVAHNGADIKIVETSNLHICETPATYPPTPTSCDTVTLAPVSFRRTWTVDNDGKLATATDEWISTDGQPHTVNAEYYTDGGYEEEPIWKFPTDSEFLFYDEGDIVEGQPSPGTVQLADSLDAGSEVGPGAMTWTHPVRYFRFTDYDYLLDHVTVAVPAGGAGVTKHAYALSQLRSEVVALSDKVEDQAGAPNVTITAPANGATVNTPNVTVTGVATDNKSIASLTVNGVAATPGAGGAYSVPLTLAPGVNAITASVTDGAGNSAASAVSVTFIPIALPGAKCIVPTIKKGSTLSSAKTALIKAGCGVGKTTRVTSKTVKAGRVHSISRKAKTELAQGTKVNIKVSKGKPKPKKKKKRTRK